MTKQELKWILNDKENWKLFEQLANDRKLKYMPYANLWNVDLRKANLKFAFLLGADLECANFIYANLGDRKLVKGGG